VLVILYFVLLTAVFEKTCATTQKNVKVVFFLFWKKTHV